MGHGRHGQSEETPIKMIKLLTVFVVATLCSVRGKQSRKGKAAALQPNAVVPKKWPPAFNVTFLTNIVSDQHTDGSSNLGSRRPIESQLFYGYANFKAQRIQHGAGSYECVHFYNTLDACTLVMTPNGMFRILSNKESEPPDCCLDMPTITCPPPSWPVSAADGREYVGEEIEKESGLVTHHWRWPMGKEGSYSHYFEDIQTSLPVKWTFPVASGRQDFYFVADTFSIGPQESTLFDLPSRFCRECQEEAVRREDGDSMFESAW